MAQTTIENLRRPSCSNPGREIEFPPPFFPQEDNLPISIPATRKIILGRGKDNVVVFERLP